MLYDNKSLIYSQPALPDIINKFNSYCHIDSKTNVAVFGIGYIELICNTGNEHNFVVKYKT